ncbi:N-acetylmuramoyl-L-alanine amidase [Pseudoalteromonas sp. NBT06-2]|uniref:N-acetylmuramoyl-L-alanine amidase n=1 Tax=Pseudoalteromonas sp. NBT06-2 TaxID=2025950 RepID=UPI000BA67422|nr:N-acetylmuramoyl-L-alanine amidase [Pseudoalteromonas sp. NBT06-2]PAJ72495.1 N-acetylmuramoyl-L-alanine amidase [Pseudoalteromonas sp. NBT06-2]
MHSLKSTIIKLFIGFIFFSSFAVKNVYAQNKITSVRVWPSPESTRVVFDLKDKPDYSYFILKKPLRLVVDLKNTSQKVLLPKVTNEHQLIKKIRFSKPKKKGWTRLVFEILEPVKPVIFSLAPTGPKKDRLVVDLFAINKKPKKAIVAKNRDISGNRDIIIAVDAGHGGEDPGSIGPLGTYEKNVTLQISKRLTKLINAEKGMRAVMPRTGDYYVKNNTRTVRARKDKVDFFISIHADAFTTPIPRGASVWVLSLGRANSEIGKWIESSEKHSDLLGGAASVLKDTQNEKYLVQAVLDMKMDHSMKTGAEVAVSILSELKKVTKMHKTKPQYASLGVLKSPDIPSILVETGFISNPMEERLLKSIAHQKKLAKAVFTSLKSYFKNNPPEDSYFAKIKQSIPERHRVKSGDSLSVLAQRYGITITKLKQANKLKSNTLFIGQNLTIPRS